MGWWSRFRLSWYWPLAGIKVMAMKEPEYREGPEALENFRRLATAILQARTKKQKRQTKKPSSCRMTNVEAGRIVLETSARPQKSATTWLPDYNRCDL